MLEFYAVVECAKIVKCLRYVLVELGIKMPGPMTLHIDNDAVLNMINEVVLLL